MTITCQAFTVALDAGHGGHDPGAIGTKAREKNITLAIVKKVGERLKNEQKDIKVVYTRSSDVYITLQGRADIANNAKADLFVSVHVNANNHHELYGTEVYTLGLHKSQSNLDVAMRENSVMTLEQGYKEKYAGFDPKSVDSYIMFECLQDRYVDKSVSLAQDIGEHFDALGRKNRGVRQAGFWVLHKTAMPAVLVEVGYITNSEEQNFLISEAGQEGLANGIYEGIVAFRDEYAKKSGKQDYTSEVQSKTDLRQEANGEDVTQEKDKDWADDKRIADSEQAKFEKEEVAKQKRRDEARKTIATQAGKTTVCNETSKSPKSTTKESVNNTANVSSKEINKAKKNEKNTSSGEVEYRLQIMALNKPLNKGNKAFKGLDVQMYEEGGYCKYTYGSEKSYTEILKRKEEIKGKFPDAMVVRFKDGKKVTK